MFSSEAGDGAAKVPEPTKEEIEANKHEWGVKYNDECLKFEKEWEGQTLLSRVMDEIEKQGGNEERLKQSQLIEWGQKYHEKKDGWVLYF